MMMPMAFTALIIMQLEQCQMIVCKFIAAVQYMHVLRQLRRGFRTIVLHWVRYPKHVSAHKPNQKKAISLLSCLPFGMWSR